MHELNEKVLNFVRQNGPILPVEVAREIKTDILLASAILADISDQHLIKISFGKVGGSPVYYIKGQEEKLQLIAKYLGEKPKKAFEILREKKLLMEKECEPWLRVALKEIKDFAVPLKANINSAEETFWKWYLLPDEEAETIAKGIIDSKRIGKREELKVEQPEVQQEPKEAKKATRQKEKKDEPEEIKESENLHIVETKFTGDFGKKLLSFIETKNIMIIGGKWLRKNSDFEAVVKIPSTAGRLNYYLKAKNKKKINEGELSLAFSEGQERKMPVIFLSSGELTKKAEQFANEKLKGLVFRKI